MKWCPIAYFSKKIAILKEFYTGKAE